MRKLRRKAIEKADAKLRNHEQMKMNNKIFAKEYLENNDAEFHEAIKKINELREISEKAYEFNLKKAANLVRKATGDDCVVGFQFMTRISDDVEVLVIHFFSGVKANEGNYYNMYFDEDEHKPYLLLKEERDAS